MDDLSSGFMLAHVDGTELYDVIVRAAATCDLVILAPGVAPAITRGDQRQHLPDELRTDVVMAQSSSG